MGTPGDSKKTCSSQGDHQGIFSGEFLGEILSGGSLGRFYGNIPRGGTQIGFHWVQRRFSEKIPSGDYEIFEEILRIDSLEKG